MHKQRTEQCLPVHSSWAGVVLTFIHHEDISPDR